MKYPIRTTLCLLLTSLCAVSQRSSAQSNQAATKFLRLSGANDNNPESLDVAVTSYKSSYPGGVTIDLVGAVHIGERSYYKTLNDLFDGYDVVLYELVAEEGTAIPKGGREGSGNPLSFLQSSMQGVLGLESQLKRIDYTKEHFVRADMTPAQIKDKMEERGDSVMTIALSTMADLMRQQNLAASNADDSVERESELGFLDLLANPRQMRIAMAKQFTATGSLDGALGGPLNRLLILDRNAEAIKGLQREIAGGKKRIAIFYGAAHMPDFEKRLTEDFGLRKAEQKWISAWDLKKEDGASNDPASLMLNLLNSLER